MMRLFNHQNVRMSRWLHELVKLAQASIDDADLMIEIMGVLANMNFHDGGERAREGEAYGFYDREI